MIWLKHFYYYTKYLLKHNTITIISMIAFTLLIALWNITSYTQGLYVKNTATASMYNTFTGNIKLLVITVIAVSLYTSDITDKTIAYIRMRPINYLFHIIVKILAITTILLLGVIPIYLSDSLLIGHFNMFYLILVILTTLNIAIISGAIAAIIPNDKTAMIIAAAYSGLSNSLHNLIVTSKLAGWLKGLSLLSPIYRVIPWAGIIAAGVLILIESRRNIRA